MSYYLIILTLHPHQNFIRLKLKHIHSFIIFLYNLPITQSTLHLTSFSGTLFLLKFSIQFSLYQDFFLGWLMIFSIEMEFSLNSIPKNDPQIQPKTIPKSREEIYAVVRISTWVKHEWTRGTRITFKGKWLRRARGI